METRKRVIRSRRSKPRARALPRAQPVVRVTLEFPPEDDPEAFSRFCLVLHGLLEARRKAARI
jgi:hypothetical protein